MCDYQFKKRFGVIAKEDLDKMRLVKHITMTKGVGINRSVIGLSSMHVVI